MVHFSHCLLVHITERTIVATKCHTPSQTNLVKMNMNQIKRWKSNKPTRQRNATRHEMDQSAEASVALCTAPVLASENPRDLQPPAEGLVEEQPRLELGDEGKP